MTQKQASGSEKSKNPVSTEVVVALIALMGTLVVAVFGYLNTRTTILLPASITQTFAAQQTPVSDFFTQTPSVTATLVVSGTGQPSAEASTTTPNTTPPKIYDGNSIFPSATWTPSPTSTDTPAVPPTVMSTPTLGNMPKGDMHFIPDDPLVAGSTRKLEVVMTASEPTKWNAPAFTSDCALTGIPSGFATDATTTHTISTIAYIPPNAAGKTCTITGIITTYGTVFATTTFEVQLKFQVTP